VRRGSAGRTIVSIGLVLLAVVVVIRGRVLAFAMTEGEALVALWPYWLLAAVLLVASASVKRFYE
jgi:hypothetical protein